MQKRPALLECKPHASLKTAEFRARKQASVKALAL
jgi:hypothetical protein